MRNKQALENKQAGESAPEGLASICSVIAVAVFVLTFVFQNMVIPSSSMASTLLVGDHVVVERESLAPAAQWTPFLHYREPRRGDVVVFYKPTADRSGEHSFLVKRVIGIPGDRIHLRSGVVYLNGVAQAETEVARPANTDDNPYVDDFPSVSPATAFGVTPEWSALLPTQIQGADLLVPAGQYFVMGDNRENSLDSRYWGFVPRQNILGRPLFVYWSIATPESGSEDVPLKEQAESTLHEVVHFVDETRWKRTFHRIE